MHDLQRDERREEELGEPRQSPIAVKHFAQWIAAQLVQFRDDPEQRERDRAREANVLKDD